jgi:very-short-patch-repair endonuclease
MRVPGRPSSNVNPYFRELFESETIIARRDHEMLGTALGRLVTDKEIQAVLPGVYALPDHREFLEIRVKALHMYDPDAILMGKIAARLSFWPELEVADVQAVVKNQRVAYKGFDFVRRKVPDDLVTDVDGVRMTVPALTALDLCLEIGGDGIDEVLRRGKATLDEMHDALRMIRNQRGNEERRQFLLESSEEPWSAAERLFHRLLREAGITGWRGNATLVIDNKKYVVDVLFREHRLAIEIDGRLFHGDARFEIDRRRQNALVLSGWRVLRFTWRMLEQEPGWVLQVVERALRAQSPSRSAA